MACTSACGRQWAIGLCVLHGSYIVMAYIVMVLYQRVDHAHRLGATHTSLARIVDAQIHAALLVPVWDHGGRHGLRRGGQSGVCLAQLHGTGWDGMGWDGMGWDGIDPAGWSNSRG